MGLVHRRLSIIDLASGDQPIGNEDGSIQVVFNGEIYNYQQLRAELEAADTRSERAATPKCWSISTRRRGRRWSIGCRGMFAFAIWDRPNRRLTLAATAWESSRSTSIATPRNCSLAPSSRRSWRLTASRADRRAALEDYLAFGMVPGARSIFRGIQKLPPAHLLVVDADLAERRPALLAAPHRARRATHGRGVAGQIRAKVDEAVRLHLIADVPVGAFLSGGLDSSVVVAMLPAKPTARCKPSRSASARRRSANCPTLDKRPRTSARATPKRSSRPKRWHFLGS